MIVIVQRDTMYPCITVTNICISRFNSRAAQSARYTLTRTLARVDYDRLRPVNHSPSLLPRFCSFYSRNVTIALIVETGSKTIVTSRDKETATFENKRANKLVLSGVPPLSSLFLPFYLSTFLPNLVHPPWLRVFNIPIKYEQCHRYKGVETTKDRKGARGMKGAKRRKRERSSWTWISAWVWRS